jgi:hypothetical protein
MLFVCVLVRGGRGNKFGCPRFAQLTWVFPRTKLALPASAYRSEPRAVRLGFEGVRPCLI